MSIMNVGVIAVVLIFALIIYIMVLECSDCRVSVERIHKTDDKTISQVCIIKETTTNGE